MSLVSRIKNLSKEKDLNLKLLEEQAGFGNGTIRRWDSSPPSADKLPVSYTHLDVYKRQRFVMSIVLSASISAT